MCHRVALALALSVLAGNPAPAEDAGIEVDAAIVLAVDASRSMDATELAVERDGYLAALRHPELMRAVAAGRLGRVAIAYFEWAAQVQDEAVVPWRIVDGPASAAALARDIAAIPLASRRGTSISRAIDFGALLLDDPGIRSPRRVIDVSGDGANNIGRPVTQARDAALARGVTINGLPIIASDGGALPDLDRYYAECVVGGDGAFVMVARTGAELARTIRRKLVVEISGTPPEPRMLPAQFTPIDCMVGEWFYRRRTEP